MNQFIRNLVLVVMLFSYPLTVLADATARPKANNKLGISKKTQEEKDNSIINKIFKGKINKVIIKATPSTIFIPIKNIKNIFLSNKLLSKVKIITLIK